MAPTGIVPTGAGGAGSGTSSTASGDSASSSSVVMGAVTGSTATATSGLVGNAQSILMYISKPARPLDSGLMTDGSALTGRKSDLQTVSYFITSSGMSGIQGAAASKLAEAPPNLDGSAPKQGLARMQGDRLIMNLATNSNNVTAMAGQTQILATELTAIQFLYYNGTTWVNTWDSLTSSSMPKAIDVQIEFPPITMGKGVTVGGVSRGGGNVYRLVIPLLVTGAPKSSSSNSSSGRGGTPGSGGGQGQSGGGSR